MRLRHLSEKVAMKTELEDRFCFSPVLLENVGMFEETRVIVVSFSVPMLLFLTTVPTENSIS
jgi:hypothetical protein